MPSRKRPKPRATTAAGKPRELEASRLRWTCKLSREDISKADKDAPLIGIIGQDRAIKALKLGITLYGPGYNVFVCGITGTGRATTVQQILNRIKGYCPLPPDRCYVHNFAKPDEPRLLSLPRGSGSQLRTDMAKFIKKIEPEIRRVLESDAHGRKREKIVAKYEGEGDRLIERFERRAEKHGFALKRVRDGGTSRPELFPVVAGQAIPMAEFETLSNEGKISRKSRLAILKKHEELRQSLEGTARQSRDLLARMEAEMADLERKEIRAALQDRADAIVARHPASDGGSVRSFLNGVLDELIAHHDLLRRVCLTAGPPAAAAAGGARASDDDDDTPSDRERLAAMLSRFEVNLIFDSRQHGDCPVVVETHPSYPRLFGYFEKTLDQSGHWTADFRHVRGGSLLAADGGYLVFTAEELFSEPEVWKQLKRTLTSRSLAILDEKTGSYVPSVTLKPQPIPIDVKVIMIGHRESYETLLENEPDFRKVFKVFADFDQEMDLNRKNLRQYAAFVRKVCAAEKLGELEPAAIAVVAEHGARKAGRQGKLSTRFGDIADVLREADYWKNQDGGGRRILARHVRTAIREARVRRSLAEDKMREMVKQELIFVDVTGSRVGQINGLVVEETGDHVFGLPARITATVSPGTTGIINIEREARLSGSTHTKGVLIIGGLLRERFGATKPVTLTASLAIEQSYGGIEGDSASSTEVYALLSALSGLPARQGIAVTGSVDQKGDIQPVGGINEKIEGFYKACVAKGIRSDQGVIVPRANIPDLMLDDEVVDAVRRGKFHIYPVSTVEEGIEILTGVAAGQRDADGRYPAGTVMGLVDERLDRFGEAVRRYSSATRIEC